MNSIFASDKIVVTLYPCLKIPEQHALKIRSNLGFSEEIRLSKIPYLNSNN